MTTPDELPGKLPDELTVDELAAATGMTVRTTRYYTSIGLLPPPVRRGRTACYGRQHVARLELVRALQEHGFTLAAIERYLSDVPVDSSVEELAAQRALLTAWKPAQGKPVTRRQLEERAGRTLSATDLDWLVKAGAVQRGHDDALWALPVLAPALELLEDELPVEVLIEARTAVRRHMAELADELTEILRTRVLSEPSTDTPRVLTNLRSLTLDAIVTGFQRAAYQLVTRSLSAAGAAHRGGPRQ